MAEMELDERPSEPLIVFAADKTEPGAWNLPLYKIFCDPFNTAGLVIDTKMDGGFTAEVHDLIEHRRIFFRSRRISMTCSSIRRPASRARSLARGDSGPHG